MGVATPRTRSSAASTLRKWVRKGETIQGGRVLLSRKRFSLVVCYLNGPNMDGGCEPLAGRPRYRKQRTHCGAQMNVVTLSHSLFLSLWPVNGWPGRASCLWPRLDTMWRPSAWSRPSRLYRPAEWRTTFNFSMTPRQEANKRRPLATLALRSYP